jgi:WD40 repeat protein
MSNADQRCPGEGTSPTRRGFVRGAGATAAGAVLLGGYRSRSARAHDEKKPKRGLKRPTCVALLDASSAATSDDDGRMLPWTIEGTKVTQGDVRDKGVEHAGKAAYVSSAPAAGRVVTAGYDGKVVVQDPLGRQKVMWSVHRGKIKPEVWVAVLSTDAGRVLLGTNDGQMQLWDAVKPDLIWSFKFSSDPVAGLALLPAAAGFTRFLSTHRGVVHLWEIPDAGKLVLPEPIQTYSHKNNRHVNAVAVSEDHKLFVSGSFDKTLRVWEVNDQSEDPKPLHIIPAHSDVVWRVDISTDKRFVASASEDKFVKVWELATKTAVATFEVQPNGSMGVSFVPGKALVVYTVTPQQQNDPHLQVKPYPT